MPEQTKEPDEYLPSKLEEFVRLKLEFDRRFGSLSGSQLFTTVVSFVLIVFVLGFMAEILMPGSPFGTIIASALATLAVIGMSKGIEKNNVRDFLEDQRELGLDENPKVYVDAKIEGRHEKEGPKQTFVAYVIGGDRPLKGFDKVDGVEESDDAELHAIAFAMDQLKGKFENYTIICDHESVVSEINRREESKLLKKRPIMNKILSAWQANPDISFKSFGANPAHAFLNEALRREETEGSRS